MIFCYAQFLFWDAGERFLLVAQFQIVCYSESFIEHHPRITAMFQWLSKYISIQSPMLTTLNLLHIYCLSAIQQF